MDLGLKGKGVLVLASSAGLGKAGAMEFAKEGAKVMLFSSSLDKLVDTVEEIKRTTNNNSVFYSVGDMTKQEDIEEVVEKSVSKLGRIDVLVNNTGGPPAGPFTAFSDADWQQAYELVLLSFIRSIRAVIPHMKAQGGGRIINSTSSSVKSVIDNLILSNTLRAGVLGLTKTLSQELGPDNILINVIGPGRIETNRTKQLDETKGEKLGISSEEIKNQSIVSIPLGRYGSSEEYAKLMVYLCSEANTYITGQTILADGGFVKAL
ncbi:SDR family oxidoreductase [Marinococcus halophilus]|uniref:SDR family oxidoreductase n=1 Tax=Marinococcus halophilus TaxID=1371 RepID=UPI0009A70FD3|nr:SDR family oxidoreductase [Marinococcus halophilus]